MIKYAKVQPPMSTVQQVAGFLANLAGRMDEAEVVQTALSGLETPRGKPNGAAANGTTANGKPQALALPPAADRPTSRNLNFL